MLLHDEVVKGNTHMYEDEFLDAAIHFVREARYWRCIGISKPFYDNNTLRAHCWEEQGLQTGTLVVSMAMRHALMDLERAVRREELGLSPDYVWDRWGPIGFVDGARNDYLPRFSHNPYVDPDGVDVTELDVLPFNTHEQIRERYGRFIFPSEEDFDGVFGAISHGSLTLDDVPNKAGVELFERMTSMSGDAPPTNNNNNNNTPAVMRRGPISPADLRTVLFLSADPAWLAMAQSKHTWLEVVEALQPTMDAANERIDAARMLSNTRHHPDRIRAYFEEMCGFHDFMRTPDKAITAAVLSYLVELKRVCSETSWGRTLAGAATDVERLAAMGRDAFVVFRHVEDAVLEKKRRLWSARFAGEANEEATLDYLLENFGRRAERPKNVGTTGVEFDREQEPIGRQVQRRTLDTDKANRLAEVRRSRGRMWSKKTSIFDALHEKQVQNTTYGVR